MKIWFDKPVLSLPKWLTTSGTGSRLPPTISETTPAPFVLSQSKDERPALLLQTSSWIEKPALGSDII